MSDQTLVTGLPERPVTGPQRGQVLGERYEVRAQLRNDAFSLGLLAFDQETEERVVLRIVRPGLLDETARKTAKRALRAAVGVGGRFLPGLSDTDLDGEYLFAVEPVAEGASLRDVLDRRIAEDRPMTEAELLPLVGHLETALAAVPPPLRHGDVRAENVWIDPHRLWLLGAFVVPALPHGAVAALLQKDSGLRRRVAPEVLRGSGSDAADRYGVGAIVYEALTLKTPPEPGEALVDLPPTPVGEQVRALLHPDPGLRARSLEPLVEALARASGLGAPELDPGTFRAPRRLSVPRPGSVVPPLKGALGKLRASGKLRGGDTEEIPAPVLQSFRDGATATTAIDQLRPTFEDGLPPPPRISDDARTQQVALASVMRPRGPEETSDAAVKTARLTPLSKKRAQEVLAKKADAVPDLDPRLVRAALRDAETERAVPLDPTVPAEPDPSGTQEVAFEELEQADEEGGVPLDPAVPAQPDLGGTQELRLDELEDADGEVPLDPSVPASPRAEGTTQLQLDELEAADDEEVDGVPLDPAVPVQAQAGGTQELRLDELEMQVQDEEQMAIRAPQAPARDVGLADLEEMRRRRAAVPEAEIQPIPRPRKDSMVGVRGPVLFDDSGAPTPQPVHEPAVVVRPPSEPPAAAPSQRPPRSTDRSAAKGASVGTPQRNWGVAIIVVALLLGAAIIIGSFAYARYQREQAEEERKQRIQDRIEQQRLQQSGE